MGHTQHAIEVADEIPGVLGGARQRADAPDESAGLLSRLAVEGVGRRPRRDGARRNLVVGDSAASNLIKALKDGKGIVIDLPDGTTTIKDDLRAIPTLSVSLHPDDLFSSEAVATDGEGDVIETRGIYPIGKGFERAASAELILPDGTGAFQIDCSVEIQGATSTDRWKTDKLSMRLKFKSPYGPSELDYPL
ncbi:MAG: hypothetical protein GY704_17020, partial [Phycisphaeraceae bacterium]|nr:hypothetical protein [Phycisphaeraceae bacterium]